MRGHRPDSSDSDSRQNFVLAGFFDGSSQTLPRPEASSLMMILVMTDEQENENDDLCRPCFFHKKEDGDEKEVNKRRPSLTEPHYLKNPPVTSTEKTTAVTR